jgi:RimJ/RimL family protein N-acetyltransferase
VLAANQPMLALCARLGFRITDSADDGSVKNATLRLQTQRGAA